jgi:hypothetical protein
MWVLHNRRILSSFLENYCQLDLQFGYLSRKCFFFTFHYLDSEVWLESNLWANCNCWNRFGDLWVCSD